ncbi:MAG: hypothetical protein M9899_08425 [Bdellovibrionaceae bacterium]|nr:hypothetical protein [Pseudobdellovibrionaceae bacterium]
MFCTFLKFKMRACLFIFMAFGPLFITHPLYAATVYVLDFDGTIVNDAGPRATWKTPWVLVRVNQLHSVAQTAFLENQPERIELSYAEYRGLLSRLAKGDGLLGDLTDVKLTPDPFLRRPLTIRPGFYKVNPDITFEYYKTNSNPKGPSHLLSSYEQALVRADKGLGRRDAWQGPAFTLLQKALSESSDQSRVIISTARDQKLTEFLHLFSQMEKDGHLKFAEPLSPESNKVIVRNLESLTEGLELGRSLSERKVQSVVETAQQLLISPLKPHVEGTTQNLSYALEAKHTLIVAEDHPGYVAKIGQKLAELSREYRFKDAIRFVLLNAGVESDLVGARWANRWTVFEGGFAREASPEEIRAWTKISKDQTVSTQDLLSHVRSQRSQRLCTKFLSSNKGGN